MAGEPSVRVRTTLLGPGTLLMAMAAVAAFYSRPDEASFRRWLVREATAREASSLRRPVAQADVQAVLAATECETTNFSFFTIVTLHTSSQPTFLGVFGNWRQITSTDAQDSRK